MNAAPAQSQSQPGTAGPLAERKGLDERVIHVLRWWYASAQTRLKHAKPGAEKKAAEAAIRDAEDLGRQYALSLKRPRVSNAMLSYIGHAQRAVTELKAQPMNERALQKIAEIEQWLDRAVGTVVK